MTSGITTRNYAGVIRNDGVVNLYDSVIENTKTSLGAGGIYNYGTLNIVRSAFRGNQAGGGGAIQNEITASLTAQCTLFQENQADYGGAVLHAASGSVVISNSRFEDNSLTGLYPDVDSRDIHNLGDNGGLPTIDAKNNQWASGIGIDDINGTGTSIQTSPTLSSNPLLTTNCQNPLPDLPYEQCPASANIQEATALSPTCQPTPPPPVTACPGTSQTDITAINTIAGTLSTTYNVTLTQDTVNGGCWTREKANVVLQSVNLQNTAINGITGQAKRFTDFFRWEIRVYMSEKNEREAAYTCVEASPCPRSPLHPNRAPREIWIWDNGNTVWSLSNIPIFSIPLMIHEFGHILSDDWRRNTQGQTIGNVDLRSAFDNFSLKFPHIIWKDKDDLIPVWRQFDEGNPSEDLTVSGRLYNTGSDIEFVAESYAIWVLFITQNGNYYNTLQAPSLVYIPCKVRDSSSTTTLGDLIIKQQDFWERIFTEDIDRGITPNDNVCTQVN